MPEWVKVGTDIGVGAAVGVGDQLIENWDDKRKADALAAGKQLGLMSQAGTYYNYGVPILAVLGSAMNFLKGDWETRALVAGGQLAGRKVTKQLTTKKTAAWTRWERDRGGGGPAGGGPASSLEF